MRGSAAPAVQLPGRAAGDRPHLIALAVSVLATLAACQPAGPGSTAPPAEPPSFHARRHAAPTRLHTRGPSPGKYEDWPAPEGATREAYDSGELRLWGWFHAPAATPAPAVVYFHGAFSLTPQDFEATRPFRDAGFSVFAPTLRGENGNPGDLELLWGELDDAIAALQWVAARPEVDPDRIYAIGHSVGGALAALTTLREDAPVRITGSVGGIYVPQTFVRWSRGESNRHLVRFDPTIPSEVELRVLGPNLVDMVHPHVAYIGDDDTWFHANADAVAKRAAAVGVPFRTERVPGDHMSSLAPGLEAFLAVITEDAGIDP